VAGIALFSLGVGCWLGRQQPSDGWALVSMLTYNASRSSLNFACRVLKYLARIGPVWGMSELCEKRPVLPFSTPKQTLARGTSAMRSRADQSDSAS
jgi:hypothetical protein